METHNKLSIRAFSLISEAAHCLASQCVSILTNSFPGPFPPRPQAKETLATLSDFVRRVFRPRQSIRLNPQVEMCSNMSVKTQHKTRLFSLAHSIFFCCLASRKVSTAKCQNEDPAARGRVCLDIFFRMLYGQLEEL